MDGNLPLASFHSFNQTFSQFFANVPFIRQVRQLQLLLQGDQLISTTFAFVVWAIASKHVFLSRQLDHVTGAIMVEFALTQISVGIACGLAFGFFIRYPFSYAYNDITTQLLLTIASIYLSFFVAEILGGSGPLSVICFGTMLSSSKIKISSSAELFFQHFWQLILYVVNTLIFFIVGLVHGLLPDSSRIQDGAFVLIIYLLMIVNRALVYLILNPFITKSGPQLSWQHLTVAVWGVHRGSTTIITSLIFFTNVPKTPISLQIITYSLIIVLLSMFFNVIKLKTVLNILGMYDLTRTRLVNMNRAMAQVYSCREKGIFSLKMDRVIADANWQVVENITTMNHPYRKKLDVADIDDDYDDETQKRVIACSECGTDVVAPPTRKELADITLEAKHRILKAQLVSFWRQYDNGTLSRHSIRILANLVESAIVKDDPVLYSSELKIQRDGSKTLRRLKTLFGFLLTATSKTHRFIPTNWFRALCFRVCTSRQFQIIMAALALLDLIFLIRLLTTYFFRDYTLNPHEAYAEFYQYLDFIFYGIFTIEFFIQLLGLGIIQYFVGSVNKIEFAASIIVRTSEIYMYGDTCHALGKMINVYYVDYIVMYMKVILLVRVTRIYIFIVSLIPKVLNMVDRQMDDDLMRSYDLGKAYLISLDRVMRFLSHIVSNETVYNNLKALMEKDRQKVAKELGLIQKDRPTIGVTIKTKHAIRHAVNIMNGCIVEMKEEGILDAIENNSLLKSMERVKKKLREITLVEPCSPEHLIREIPWLVGDADHANFFLAHARLSSYGSDEVIIHYGDNPNGLYILVSGLVKAYYKPTKDTMTLSTKFGVVPNYDFFLNLRFDLPQEDYIVGGNVFGEMGIVTGRPYEMKIVAETAAHVYYIPWNIVKAAVQDSSNSAVVKARIWKTIGMKLSLNILHHSAQFQGWPRERILLYLQRGLVPILSKVQSLQLNEHVSDILLIEGAVMDQVTRTIYYGPYYLPRSIQKIIFPEHPAWKFRTDIEPRLLIIPKAHTDQEDLMGPEGLFKDHYMEAQEEEDEEEEECDHGGRKMSKQMRNIASRLLQAQRRRHKKVGFMDFTPHVSGPIEGIPTKTTYIFKKDKKKKDIESSQHPRTMLDSKIPYTQDIKEESETGSMHDDEEDDENERKRKSSRRRASSKRLGRSKGSVTSFDSRSSSIFGFTTVDDDDTDRKIELQVVESSSEEEEDELTKGVQTRLQIDESLLDDWRQQKPFELPYEALAGFSMQFRRSNWQFDPSQL